MSGVKPAAEVQTCEDEKPPLGVSMSACVQKRDLCVRLLREGALSGV